MPLAALKRIQARHIFCFSESEITGIVMPLVEPFHSGEGGVMQAAPIGGSAERSEAIGVARRYATVR